MIGETQRSNVLPLVLREVNGMGRMTHRRFPQPISMIAELRRSSGIKPGNTIWEGPLVGNAPSFFAAGAGISSIRGRHWVLGAKGPVGTGWVHPRSALGPRLMEGSCRLWVLGTKGPVGAG